ncbi:hypothetical protein GCM10023163_31100 [Aestuariibaculum suncheonense]
MTFYGMDDLLNLNTLTNSSCFVLNHKDLFIMAKQTGIIKLKGALGDLSFYKTSDGHLARIKSGVDANKIATDPAFQRTRENGMEFGRAGKGGKVIRHAIRVLLQHARDKRVVSRLAKTLLAIIKTDPINGRGDRTITAGNMHLLNKFEFNSNVQKPAILSHPQRIKVSIARLMKLSHLQRTKVSH